MSSSRFLPVLPAHVTLVAPPASDGPLLRWPAKVGGSPATFVTLDAPAAADVPLLTAFEESAAALRTETPAAALRVLEVGRTPDGAPYALEERVTGISATGQRERDGFLRAADVTAMGVLAAEGLADAHGRRRFHGRLRPTDLWITPSGALKLAGLGWSPLHDAGRAAGRFPHEGVFAPPAGAAPVTAAAIDAYALGACLFALLTGRLPAGEPVATWAPEMPAVLRRVVDDAVALEPSRWWASPAALALALRDAYASLAGRPLEDPAALLRPDDAEPPTHPRGARLAAAPKPPPRPATMPTFPTLRSAGSAATARPHDLLPKGTRVGRYVLDTPAPWSGARVTYRAVDTILGRTVALRVARRRGDGAQAVPALLQDARISALMDHPRILTVHDVGSDRDLSYAAFAWVEGTLLRAVRESNASRSERLGVLLDVAEALAAAHAAGVVHGSVDGEHVLVGSDGRAWLHDFSSAQRVERKDLDAAGSKEHADAAGTDQRAWAKLAAEVLGRDAGEPGPDSRVLLRALAPTLEDRYASVLDAAQALLGSSGTDDGPPLPSRPSSLLRKVARLWGPGEPPKSGG